jgi:hypothetical protein
MRKYTGTSTTPVHIVLQQIDSGRRYWASSYGTTFVNTTVMQVLYTSTDPAAFAHERDRLGAAALFPQSRA